MPPEILTRLRMRKKNSKVVSLDFKVPNMPSLPGEEEVWQWLARLNLTEDAAHEIDYFEREVIEKKYYIRMKEESGADWLAEKLEAGLKFKVSEEVEVMIKGRKEGEQWLAVVVRGVDPNTDVKAVEAVFKQFGEVKEVEFVAMGPRKVRSNKLNMKVKLEEGKSLPGFVMAPFGEGGMERWEVTSKGPGGPKVCLQCYQPGHIRKHCPNQAPTMADVVGGRAGAAISYAQVLAGTRAAHSVVLVQQPSLQPPLDANALARRAASQDSASQKNGAVSSGQHSGETVSNPLISPVATTTQAPEVLAAEQTPVKQTSPSSVELVKQINDGKLVRKAVAEEIEKLQRICDTNMQEDKEEEMKSDKEKLEELEGRMAAVLRREARDNKSRERKRKTREESSGERARSASEKRKREERRKSREEEEELRKTREDYPPHKGYHGKQRSDSYRAASRNNGYHN